LKKRKGFEGELFLTYLMLYAAGRFALEFFRADSERGFIIENYISHSQFIALSVAGVVGLLYLRWRRLNIIKEGS
jgi:phosphatidylglycerol---prolipoprotein diacylglyceryl transferase